MTEPLFVDPPVDPHSHPGDNASSYDLGAAKLHHFEPESILDRATRRLALEDEPDDDND